MRILIQALLKSLPDFANVGVFMLFVFSLFATMGVQQYSGAMYNTCRYTERPDGELKEWKSDLRWNRVCSTSEYGNFMCPEGEYCGNIEDYRDIDFHSEKYNEREYLNFAVTNYDNVANSMLTVF